MGHWQTAYYSLKAFEKLASLQPALITCEASEPLWRGMSALLLHAHGWVRNAAARLLGCLFAEARLDEMCSPLEATAPTREADGGVAMRFLGRRGTLLQLGDAVLEQLQSAGALARPRRGGSSQGGKGGWVCFLGMGRGMGRKGIWWKKRSPLCGLPLA